MLTEIPLCFSSNIKQFVPAPWKKESPSVQPSLKVIRKGRHLFWLSAALLAKLWGVSSAALPAPLVLLPLFPHLHMWPSIVSAGPGPVKRFFIQQRPLHLHHWTISAHLASSVLYLSITTRVTKELRGPTSPWNTFWMWAFFFVQFWGNDTLFLLPFFARGVEGGGLKWSSRLM